MDYTLSDAYLTDATTGHRRHQDDQPVTTEWSAKDANSIIWNLMEVLNDAGVVGSQFDPTDPTSYTKLKLALDTIYRRKADVMVSALDIGVVRSTIAVPADAATATANRAKLQTLLDSGVPFELPAGVYDFDQELVWKRGSRCYGPGNWSGVESDSIDAGSAVLRYRGAGGANTCAIRLSSQPVGTEPVDAATRDLQNIALSRVVVDAGVAEIGVYAVRAWSNTDLDFITVTGSTKYAFLAMACWNGVVRNWVAYKVQGAGVILGKNVYGWSIASCDQSVTMGFLGNYVGCDSSGTPLNDFDEATDTEKEIGIGVYDARGLVMIDAQALNCSGPGIFTEPRLGTVRWQGGYSETNGRSSNSTHQWNIWFAGESGGGSYNTVFDGMHLGGTSAVRLTGTEPARKEGAPRFVGMTYLGAIKADWRNYRLIDSDRNATFLDQRPNWFRGRFSNALNLDAAGIAVFNATTGAISMLLMEGLVASVTRTAAGTYQVTLDETFTSARMAIEPHTTDGYRVAPQLSSINTNSFTLLHRDTATNTLTDAGARITLKVHGYYV